MTTETTPHVEIGWADVAVVEAGDRWAVIVRQDDHQHPYAVMFDGNLITHESPESLRLEATAIATDVDWPNDDTQADAAVLWGTLADLAELHAAGCRPKPDHPGHPDWFAWADLVAWGEALEAQP